MSVSSTDLETSVLETYPDTSRQHRDERSMRRKRSMRRTVGRQFDQMLQSRHLIPVGLGLLLLAGFVYVSLVNEVFSSKEETAYVTASARNPVERNRLSVPNAEVPELTRFFPDPVKVLSDPGQIASESVQDTQRLAVTDGSSTVSVTPLASAWLPGDFDSLTLLPDQAGASTKLIADQATEELNHSLNDGNSAALASSGTYAVNEGGSLWRTARRFIDDVALIDGLIDNLELNGMDVRSVRPGVAFVVEDLGNDGMLVTVDNRGTTYESRIVGGRVITSAFE